MLDMITMKIIFGINGIITPSVPEFQVFQGTVGVIIDRDSYIKNQIASLRLQ
jgi:hypothetical protein